MLRAVSVARSSRSRSRSDRVNFCSVIVKPIAQRSEFQILDRVKIAVRKEKIELLSIKFTFHSSQIVHAGVTVSKITAGDR